jgi:hypothetical protein
LSTAPVDLNVAIACQSVQSHSRTSIQAVGKFEDGSNMTILMCSTSVGVSKLLVFM